LIGRLAPVPLYFCLRIASALLLLKLSAAFLPVNGFSAFAQLMLFASLLNLVALGGAQNGLVRQAAAAPDASSLVAVRRAGFRLWLAIAPALALAITFASAPIARVLVGTSSARPAVIAVAMLALAAGPGQIWCSMLTGRGRVAASLGAQATGVAVGTALAAWLIVRGAALAAAIAFAAGPLATMLVAARRTTAIDMAPAAPRADTPSLLRYSAAFVAGAGTTSLLLFGLRFVYREAFGASALGWWMAANRISDMSTQLLGLFLIQIVVPHLAALGDAAARRAFLLRCWAAGAGAMAAALLVFALASRPLVHLFLSDAYLPAIPMIRTYLAGDLLRVWASLAMFAAFAAGKPGRYAAIEIATMGLMAAITLSLIRFGIRGAPAIGYAAAYGLAAIVVTVGFTRPLLRAPALRLRQREP
jgi:O-antigen/teichoic acid export membrane protein